jgi:sigma-B regulation protein RsbU (phosphoserine phosphatase)
MSNSLILWAFFGVVVATIAAILIAISLTKPLLRLTKAASIVSSGDFSVKIEGHGRSDEIGTLSTAFIKMVGDLNHYINELTETTKLKERAESELRLGRDIQQNFIPKEFPQLDTIEFWGMCEPARLVGGDFIDYITINEHKYGFVVGDVSGKGVPAALFLSMCRTLFRTICVQIESPEKVLEEFNNKIIELDPSGNMFITLLYCIFDWETGKMYFSTAGHNMPFIRLAKKSREQASFEMLPPIKTMVAGMIEDISFELVEIALSRGDILVLYTDGMTEAMNDKGEMFGEAKLIELLNNKYHLSAKQICEETVMEVKDFQIGMEQFDDMTMFVLKLKEA